MSKEQQKNVILSADDDENAHVLLSLAFNKGKAKSILQTVTDGSDALRYLAGEGKFSDRTTYPFPDLLLLDLKMPRVSGFDVLQHIQNQPTLKDLPVIVFSSSDNESDLKRAHALGCTAYVVKPTKFDRLVELVAAIEADFLGAKNKNEAHLSHFALILPAGDAPHDASISAPGANQRESSDIFRVLVEQVKDYAIFLLDKEGYVRSWNEGARRIKGYEASEIIGKHFSSFYPQQDKDNEKPQFELRMAQDMGRYEEEGWRVRKDGSRFWANAVITPLRGRNGELTGYAKVTRDLTQRKIQEENIQKLLDNEERFRLLVDQVKDYAIFLLDPKGNIVSWNQGARLVKGYTADEIIGKHFSVFYTPDDLSRGHPAWELSVAIRDGRYEEEGWRVKKDGSRFWANVVITALWDKRGNLTGFAKVTRDLTQRKREADALRQKTDDLEAFAHTLSHDLRAPLRSISSFSQLMTMQAGELSAEEMNAYAKRIFSAAQSMDGLINDVLKLSHLSLAPAHHEKVSVERILQQTVELLQSDIEATNAAVEIKRPMPVVKANPTLLLQIFSNLISNAIKFSHKDHAPRIQIYTVKKDAECDIHVKDNGVGIPKEFHSSIFNAFDRGSAEPDTAGSGIGLAIVKKAVERLGGRITVHSEKGQGSDFVLTLACDISESVVSSGGR